MKIEIEWSREDVLDILKFIAWIPEVIIQWVHCENTVRIEPEQEPVESAQEQEPEEFPADYAEPVDIPAEEPPKPKKARSSPKSEGGGTLSRKIDVFVWENGKWFTLEESFDSISATARYIWVSHAANISPYVDSWKVYKGKYKFISRKA